MNRIMKKTLVPYRGLNCFGPNINIFRDPRWGRGSETYGEDPHLTSQMGVAFVQGIQGADPVYIKVIVLHRHFRFWQTRICFSWCIPSTPRLALCTGTLGPCQESESWLSSQLCASYTESFCAGCTARHCFIKAQSELHAFHHYVIETQQCGQATHTK